MHINPEKALYCLCIGISEYTTIDNGMGQKNFSKKNSSLNIIEEESPTMKYELTDELLPEQAGTFSMNEKTSENFPSESSTESQNSNCKITMSQRVFCISSYYPFFSFYE